MGKSLRPMGRKVAWLQPRRARRTCNNFPSGFDALHVMVRTKREKVSTLQLESDSKTGNLETQLNLIQMVNNFHMPNSIYELMFVVVQVIGI